MLLIVKVKYYCFVEDKDDKGQHKELLKHRDYKVMMIMYMYF